MHAQYIHNTHIPAHIPSYHAATKANTNMKCFKMRTFLKFEITLHFAQLKDRKRFAIHKRSILCFKVEPWSFY